MDFKYIHQPEYAIEFRVFDNVSGEIFPAIGFDDESVYAVLDGEIESLDRTDCEIDQWIGLLDQDERKSSPVTLWKSAILTDARSGCSSSGITTARADTSWTA
jgi:hypothetical protein